MTTCSVTSTPARFARCLANFQVDELLLLKKSVQRMQLEELTDEGGIDYSVMSRSITSTTTTAPITEIPPLEGKEEMPERLPLMAADRGGHDPGPWHSSDHHHQPSPTSWEEQKPTKLQTLFQISITGLAFLSFGGYLLCLIVQAIKSKGTTYFHPVASTAASNGNTKRIKVYRRGRRSKPNPSPIGNILQQDYGSYMRNIRGRILT